MKLTIKTALIGGIIGLLIISISILLASSFLTSEKVLQNHAEDIMDNITMLTIQQSQSYLEPARDAVKLTERLANSDVVSSEDRLVLERYFLEQLALHSQISGIYVGNNLGEFIYVMKNDTKIKGGYKSKFIDINDGNRSVEIIWRNPLQQELYREVDPEDKYDPRTRPWYNMALHEKRLIWTDPYIFYTSQKPGITTASPVFLKSGKIKGIVGVDIEIDDISVFLSKLKVGKNGLAFIMNRNGDVIAFPDQSKIKHPLDKGSGQYRLTKISELDDPLSRKAYESALKPIENFNLLEPIFSTFRHENMNYHVMFSPFAKQQWPWIIGIYLPEDDYLGPIKSNRLFNILLGLAIAAIASIAGLVLARSISQPMVALQSEAMAVKGYDLVTTFDKRSVIKEVQQLSDAFAQMKAGLEVYKNTNETIKEELKQRADELRQNEMQLRATFTSLVNFADALIVLDKDGIIRFMNPAAETLLHAKSSYLKGQGFPFELSRDRKKELKIASQEGMEIIVEMSVVDTEWEGQVALLVSLRDVSERKQAEVSLNESNLQLRDTVNILTRREQELTSIGKMAEFFQVCANEEELLKVVSENMESLFPVEAGMVYILNEKNRNLSTVYSWGEHAFSQSSFSVDDCWGLKKGQPHELQAGKSRLFCDHINHEGNPGRNHICIPIATSSEQLGLLYLQAHPSVDDNTQDQKRNAPSALLELGVTVAEHIALALSNVRMQAKLQTLAIQDPLTGLYNRRYMQEYLEHEIHRASREKRPIGIILLDIDHFKSINDEHGHDAGDHVLVTMAELLQAHVRKGDVCCRYGGEEFLFILPNSSYQDTIESAEKLRRQVKLMEINVNGERVSALTVSMGVASYPEQGNTYDELIKSADNALYGAKGQGRDRVS